MSKKDFINQIREQLQKLRMSGCYREVIARVPLNSGMVKVEGREVVSFGSNDYLGFANEERIKRAFIDSCQREGFGSTGSRLLSGHRECVEQCERSLSEWLRFESCLLFNSGFQANVGTIPSLVSDGDGVVFDRDVHASIIDGIRLSKAEMYVYPHGDIGRARALAKRAAQKNKNILLVTESIFSMSGMVAPLRQLDEIAKECGALLYVDEAHALGVCGQEGRGVCDQLGIRPEILVGTAGKAMGSVGAFVLGECWLRELLINRARSFIFSTANPAGFAVAIKEGIELCRSSLGDERRLQLGKNIRSLRDSLMDPSVSDGSPIIAIPIGSNEGVIRLSKMLMDGGYWVPGIRAPSVKPGSERLRISLSSAHSEGQIHDLIRTLKLSRANLRI